MRFSSPIMLLVLLVAAMGASGCIGSYLSGYQSPLGLTQDETSRVCLDGQTNTYYTVPMSESCGIGAAEACYGDREAAQRQLNPTECPFSTPNAPTHSTSTTTTTGAPAPAEDGECPVIKSLKFSKKESPSRADTYTVTTEAWPAGSSGNAWFNLFGAPAQGDTVETIWIVVEVKKPDGDTHQDEGPVDINNVFVTQYTNDRIGFHEATVWAYDGPPSGAVAPLLGMYQSGGCPNPTPSTTTTHDGDMNQQEPSCTDTHCRKQ